MRRRTSATIVAAAVSAVAAVSAGASELAGKPSFTEAGQFGQTQLAKGLTTGADGTVVVADTNNNRIQLFTPTGGSKGAFGGTGTASGKFMGPADVDVAPDGNVWVADYTNYRLQELRPDGSFVRAVAQGQFLSPGVGIDKDGNVYAVKLGANGASTVQKYDKASNFAPTTSWGGGSYARDLEVSPDGSIYVANEGTPRGVLRFDLAGKSLGSIPAGASNPLGIGIDLDCNVWVGDIGGRRIVKYSPSGKLLGEVKPKTETIAFDVAFGPNGDMYVSNGGNKVMRLTEDKKPGTAAVPGRIAAKLDGKAYVANVPYAPTGIACPDTLGATATIAGKGIAGKASGLQLPIGKATAIDITLKGKALTTMQGRTVPAMVTIVLQTNGRTTTQTKKVVISIPKKK